MEERTNDRLTSIGEIELVYKRRGSKKISERPQIKTSQDAYDVLRPLWDDGKINLFEQLKILLLNRAGRVLTLFEASQGGVTGTIVDPKIILVAALKAGASSLVMAHNHPSESAKPSLADEEVTQKMKQACALLDLKLLDHLIITTEGYFSFCDDGLL